MKFPQVSVLLQAPKWLKCPNAQMSFKFLMFPSVLQVPQVPQVPKCPSVLSSLVPLKCFLSA